MMIRSATALRNDYDGMVKLSTEKQEPIYLTRSGDGEMVFLPIDALGKTSGRAGAFCGHAAQGANQTLRCKNIFRKRAARRCGGCPS